MVDSHHLDSNDGNIYLRLIFFLNIDFEYEFLSSLRIILSISWNNITSDRDFVIVDRTAFWK